MLSKIKEELRERERKEIINMLGRKWYDDMNTQDCIIYFLLSAIISTLIFIAIIYFFKGLNKHPLQIYTLNAILTLCLLSKFLGAISNYDETNLIKNNNYNLYQDVLKQIDNCKYEIIDYQIDSSFSYIIIEIKYLLKKENGISITMECELKKFLKESAIATNRYIKNIFVSTNENTAFNLVVQGKHLATSIKPISLDRYILTDTNKDFLNIISGKEDIILSTPSKSIKLDDKIKKLILINEKY